jgi:hypothetical protein
MVKKILIIIFIASIFTLSASDRPMKILHMTFHEGCKNDFEDVAQELGLEVTSWYVQALPSGFWEGFSAGNEIYNVGHRRAQRVWDLHKDFFDQFDVIITSDTAPLSRIFLQNGWQKPLIIWVCNRFDYRHAGGGEDRFPEPEYYELIRKATTMKNVRIIAYTPFEYEYARRKGINFEKRSIKPIGKKEQEFDACNSFIPSDVHKEDTLFIFPRLEHRQINQVIQECAQRGIKSWSGVYNGPEDLKDFKGVLFFPYAFSNLALFENLLRGVIHFVPTKRFLNQLRFVRAGMEGNLDWCEWYFDIYKDYFVFFDSWHDLQKKAQTLNYSAMQQKIKQFGLHHRNTMIEQWRNLFAELVQ